MSKAFQPIRGIKWFRDILNDQSRQFGAKVYHHLPAKEVSFKPFGSDGAIRLPEDTELINLLRSRYGESATLRKYPDTYAATIQDGILVGNSGMVITPDRYLIAETAALTGHKDNRCLSIQDLQKTNFPLQYGGHLDGNVLSAANPNSGYGHHLVESFFSLIWFDNCPIDYIHVAEGLNYSRMSEFLSALKIPVEAMAKSKPMEFMTASEVSFFGPSSYTLLREETIDRVENILIKSRRPNVIPIKKYYLTVGAKSLAAKNRTLNNEKELQSYIVSKGYECIDPALYDIEEKINLFSQASHIISHAGSGSYNAFFFTPPDVTLAHIHPAQSPITSMLNCVGNFVVLGYSDSPILPIYPDFCVYNNRLMGLAELSKFQLQMSYHKMTQKYGEFYTNIDGSINIEKFDDYLNLLTNH